MSAARLLVFALLAATACGVRAWFPSGGALWPDGPVPLSFGSTPAMPAGADWDAATREAATLWNVSLQRVRLEITPATAAAWYENGRNEVFFDHEMFAEPFPSGVLAVTSTTYDRGMLVESDIVVNAHKTWSVYSGPWRSSAGDFRRVIVHELGHLLGLNHPDEQGQDAAAIMNSRAGDLETITADDQAGARALYNFGPGAAPVIITHPGTVSAVQGQTVKLQVSAGGRGPLAYEWQRDGTAVPNATAAALEFTAGLDDAGVYTAVVRNEGGTVISSPARVNVARATAPIVATPFSRSDVAAGTMVSISPTLIDGHRPMRFEWRKEGVPVPSGTAETLVLKDVQFSDSGSYTLTVTNAAGSATTGPVQVQVAPPRPLRFNSSLAPRAVKPAGAVTLTAPVAHSADLTYQWQKDGIDIPGARGSSYAISRFRPSDVGAYTVVVSNAFGRIVSDPGELTTFGVADFVIARQPAAITDYVGASVSFSVGMDLPVTSYQWFKDGVALPSAPQRPGQILQEQVLRLNLIGPASSGVYSVEVSDGTRKVMSRGARLTVIPPAEAGVTITQHPSAHSVVAGTTVNLTVSYVPTTGVSVLWLKDGVPLSLERDRSMRFTATPASAGRYRARLTTGTLVVESDEVLVEIVPTPRLISVHPPSRMLSAGEELHLLVATDEIARRRAVREEGGVYYYTRNGVRVDSPYLAIPSSPGVYTLTVGRAGVIETSHPFTVGVLSGRPVIRIHPQGGSIIAGDAVRLGVQATPTDVTYQWYKDGVALIGQVREELSLSAFGEQDRGSYTVAATNSSGRSVSEPAVLEIRGFDAPLIQAQPNSVTVEAGRGVNLSVLARGGHSQFQWLKEGARVTGATKSDYFFVGTAATAGAYTVTVTQGTTSATSRVAHVRVLAAARGPELLIQPSSGVAPLGGDFELSVVADGAPLPDRYQWHKDGVPIPGANDAKLRLRDVSANTAGAYTVLVTNTHGSVLSQAASVAVDRRGRMVNLATRASVGTGSDILIAGFTISGSEPRRMLIRGIGDQLAEFGVGGVLRDPVLKLYDAKTKVLARNDDWSRTTEQAMAELQAAARESGAFAQRTNTRDAAILATLEPGSYTTEVSGLASTKGVALVEIYELGEPGQTRLVNLSSRAVVGVGANILIPGFVLSGTAPRRLLLRAVGPALTEMGVQGALEDPILTVFRGSESIAQNDDWTMQPDAAQVAATMPAVGAFPLKPGSHDAALLLDLEPGNYTVQVAGAEGKTGIALVEVYEVPTP